MTDLTPPIPLKKDFVSVCESLPDGAVVTGFRLERYIPVGKNGPEEVVRELLVDLKCAQGSTGAYFDWLHANGLSAAADRPIVALAIKYAVAKKLFPIALNVAPESALDVKFIDFVLDTLDDHGVDPHDVVLEITERFTPPADADFSSLAYARKKKLRLAADDGDPRDGERLTRLLPYCDFLKIDKSPVRDHIKGRYPEFSEDLHRICAQFPVKVVIEGVRASYPAERPDLPIYATQKREDAPFIA